jgi:allantoinase
MRFALSSRRVVLPDGIRPAAVLIEDGRIAGVVSQSSVPADFHREDFGDVVIAPGVIDTHVHINEPGRTDWEGFETATKAAAAGGVTTLVDMPLNSSPVTKTVAALDAKRAAAQGKCWVDVGFYGGIVPGNSEHIEPLINAGVLGMKAFLCHSGLDEFPAATRADLQAAAPILAKYDRPLLVHGEVTDASAPKPASAHRYADYLTTRPPKWEADALSMLVDVCAPTRCPVHVVHLANSDLLALYESVKRMGLPLTVETCPHYLHFAAEAIPDGDTRYKCAPPIREHRHREQLWQGLKQGTIDTIGSDHSPCPPGMKQLESGNFMAAWGGISSLQLTLSIVWTDAQPRGVEVEAIFRLLSTGPAELVGLDDRKGRLASGYDADVIVWDPNAEYMVRGEQLHHRHKLTPYEGEHLKGQVLRTYVRGNLVYCDGQLLGAPCGQLLTVAAPRRSHEPSIGEYLNQLDADSLRAALAKCCSSERWLDRMIVERPFTGNNRLLLRDAAVFWWAMDREDWLEAFAAHPKIGDVESLRAKFAGTRDWAGGEQSGVAGASEGTLNRLAELNRDYEARFGYIFIVCATGKSADEMLAILESRLPNDPQTEVQIAATEQLKITQLRLRKLSDTGS